ncbi:MAG: ABC transporter ATP-binding protein [Acidimicrobiales bacterium]|nr:ABC transporter ATP-binding protein [Acidimicrobiales bacterium]
MNAASTSTAPTDHRRPADFEPVGVEPHYPPPSGAIDPDQSLGWVRRMYPVLRAHRTGAIVAAVAGLFSVLANNLVPLTIKDAIDEALDARTAGLNGFVVWLCILGIVLFVSRLTYRYLLFRTAYSIETDLRNQIYNHLTRLSFSYYDRTPSGEVISRANSDIRSIQLLMAFGPLTVLMLVSFVMAFSLMLTLHVGLTLLTVATMPFVFLTAQHLRGQLYPLMWLTQARTAELATVVDENINGTRVVKSFAAEQTELTKLARSAQRLRWSSVATMDTRARHNPIIEALPRIALALVLLYGGLLAIDGDITVGTIVAFSTYVVIISTPFRMVGFVLVQAQRAAASAERIYEIFDTEPDIVDAPDAVHLSEVRGAVSFENVRFTYPAADATGQRPEVLHDFSLDIEPGETVAIVGRTGSGKSTVVRLLPRFYDVDAGAVRIDGHDVRDLTLTSVRHHVGMVLDEPFLFSTSVRDNIAFGRPNASDAEVVAAAKAAQAHDFISELTEGYDTVVGERGYTLSGGQRQRIALARTLLENPTVLVLDDATSAIDVQVEEKIHQALRALTEHRTTLIIAHRLSTIALADRVVLLADGRVVASGTHAELLATEPRYAAVLATTDDAEPTEEGAQ